MWPNSQFPTDLVTFTEETLNGKLSFLCSNSNKSYKNVAAEAILKNEIFTAWNTAGIKESK